MKPLILLFGVLGLAGMVIPFGGLSFLITLLKFDMVQGLLYASVFVLPIIAAAMAMSKPPMQAWQPILALAGFGLGVVKFRVWEALPHIADAGVQGILILGSIVGGCIVSIIAIVKPEPTA